MIEKDSGSEDGKNSSERASESTAATDLDWHPDDLDPEEVLAETSLIIASNRERNYTADSAPDWIGTVVRTDEGRNVARNRGIEAASGEWIVVADDDITFPTQLTATLVHGVDRRHVVGLEDFPPMEWILTRYVIFHRST